MDELLTDFGKKVFGMHSHELHEQSSPIQSQFTNVNIA
jgi:hypothetical protein